MQQNIEGGGSKSHGSAQAGLANIHFTSKVRAVYVTPWLLELSPLNYPSYVTDGWIQQREDDRVTISGNSVRQTTPMVEDLPPHDDTQLQESSLIGVNNIRSPDTLPSREVILAWESGNNFHSSNSSLGSTASVSRPRAPGIAANEPFGAPPGCVIYRRSMSQSRSRCL